ncbi:hypothetical protein SBA2_280019 [Acidobacteriia bacterium SbA2]|nr:hypothetical protein SBA2_280019 [Acidobacteriia bacterium SbA2]
MVNGRDRTLNDHYRAPLVDSPESLGRFLPTIQTAGPSPAPPGRTSVAYVNGSHRARALESGD